MTNVSLKISTRKCIPDNQFLGYEGENEVNKLIFKFEDGFFEGSALLNIQKGEQKGYVTLDRIDETYELTVKNSLLSQKGDVRFQLVITSTAGQKAYAKAVADTIISYYGLKKTETKKGYTGTFPSLGTKGYLSKNDKGINVKRLQEFLNWCINAKLSLDSSFGPATEKAVKKYQKTYGLTQDKLFGPACLKKAKSIKK